MFREKFIKMKLRLYLQILIFRCLFIEGFVIIFLYKYEQIRLYHSGI